MNKWLSEVESLQVFYKDCFYDYSSIEGLVTSLKQGCYEIEQLSGDDEFSVNIMCIETEENFYQFICVLYALKLGIPIYFGRISELTGLLKNSDLEGVFLIATTSGTSGRKKVILKEHGQWLKSFKDYGEIFNITGDDKLFVNGSLEYTANLYSVLHMLILGGKIVFSMANHPRLWVAHIIKTKCTTSFLVPSKLRLLLKAIKAIKGFSHCLNIVTAGEPLNASLIRKASLLAPNVKINHYYGAAEIGYISGITHEELLVHPGSVGKSFPAVRVEIRSNQIYAKSKFSQSKGTHFDSAFDYGYVDVDGYIYLNGRQDTQLNIYGRKFDGHIIVELLEEDDSIEAVYFVRQPYSPAVGKDLYGLFVVTTENEHYITDRLNHIANWMLPNKIVTHQQAPITQAGKVDFSKIQSHF